jgi:hypothetical protein
MNVEDIMTADVITVGPEESVDNRLIAGVGLAHTYGA